MVTQSGLSHISSMDAIRFFNTDSSFIYDFNNQNSPGITLQKKPVLPLSNIFLGTIKDGFIHEFHCSRMHV